MNSIKKQIIVIISIFINLTLISQEFIPGVKLGINNSTFKTNLFEAKSIKSISVGATLTALLNDKLDLISEYTYSKRGGLISSASSQDSSINSFDLSFHAFDFSLIFNYYLKAPNFSLQAGPIFGFYRSTPSDLESLINNSTFNSTSNLSNEELFYAQNNLNNGFNMPKTKGFDIALALGLSGGTEEFKLNLRYILGLSNFYTSESTYDFDKEFKMKNNMIQLSIIYNLTNLRIIRN